MEAAYGCWATLKSLGLSVKEVMWLTGSQLLYFSLLFCNKFPQNAVATGTSILKSQKSKKTCRRLCNAV